MESVGWAHNCEWKLHRPPRRRLQQLRLAVVGVLNWPAVLCTMKPGIRCSSARSMDTPSKASVRTSATSTTCRRRHAKPPSRNIAATSSWTQRASRYPRCSDRRSKRSRLRRRPSCTRRKNAASSSKNRNVVAQHCNQAHGRHSTKREQEHWTSVKMQTFFASSGFQQYFTVHVPDEQGTRQAAAQDREAFVATTLRGWAKANEDHERRLEVADAPCGRDGPDGVVQPHGLAAARCEPKPGASRARQTAARPRRGGAAAGGARRGLAGRTVRGGAVDARP